MTWRGFIAIMIWCIVAVGMMVYANAGGFKF